jgi:hypothetical protein
LSETPIGQSPATGGRVKQYATAADRAKAFRNRQKELVAIAKGSNHPGEDALTEQPESSITSLAYAIGELRRIGEFQTHFAQRIEEAVSRVADPERLDTALETTRTQALEQVSRAKSIAADAKSDAHEARAELREVARERDAALEDAADALERLVAAEQYAHWLIAEARHRVVEAEEYSDSQVAAAERDRDVKVGQAKLAQAAAEDAARSTELAAQTRADELEAAHSKSLQAVQRAADERVDLARADAARQVQDAHAATAIADNARIRAEAERDAAKDVTDNLRNDLRAARDEITRLREQPRMEDRPPTQRALRPARPITPQARRRRTL